MKIDQPEILNKYGERLDTLVEWTDDPKAIVVMVHGIGTNKHETGGFFDDISSELAVAGFRVVRFDASGFGKSEGRSEDFCFQKQADDLDSVISWTRQRWMEPIHVLAQSMGCFATLQLSPKHIAKSVLINIPNWDTEMLFEHFTHLMKIRRGGVVNYEGISLLPRSSGEIQRIGPGFWKGIREFKPVKKVSRWATLTELMIIHTNQDEILGTDKLKEYDSLPGVEALWLDGNHSFKQAEDRRKMIKVVKSFFSR